MTTQTVKTLNAGATLTGSAVAYYTAPAQTYGVVKNAVVTNTTGAPVALTLYRVPSGGTADAAHTLISARSIAAGATDLCPELVNKVIEPGASIQALGNGLSISIDGVEVVPG